MYKFALPLKKSNDVLSDMPVFGFVINDMFISKPFLSDCGRFDVDPTETYGISKEDALQLDALNELVTTATNDALDAGCRTIQERLAIATGDVAGIHFSGDENVRPVAEAMADYILSEYNLMHLEG